MLIKNQKQTRNKQQVISITSTVFDLHFNSFTKHNTHNHIEQLNKTCSRVWCHFLILTSMYITTQSLKHDWYIQLNMNSRLQIPTPRVLRSLQEKNFWYTHEYPSQMRDGRAWVTMTTNNFWWPHLLIIKTRPRPSFSTRDALWPSHNSPLTLLNDIVHNTLQTGVH